MDPYRGPKELQTKVQFDVRYYFCRQGVENIYDMTQDTFELGYDVDTGLSYVIKKRMKNRRTTLKQPTL